MTDASGPTDGSPGVAAETAGLLQVLDQLRSSGWTTDLVVAVDGAVVCPDCGGQSSAGSLEPVALRRLEGESDPADMQLVVAAKCPACQASGVLTLGFGPNADENDADVLAVLDVSDQSCWPPPPADEATRS